MLFQVGDTTMFLTSLSTRRGKKNSKAAITPQFMLVGKGGGMGDKGGEGGERERERLG